MDKRERVWQNEGLKTLARGSSPSRLGDTWWPTRAKQSAFIYTYQCCKANRNVQGHSPASAAGCGCVNGMSPVIASHTTARKMKCNKMVLGCLPYQPNYRTAVPREAPVAKGSLKKEEGEQQQPWNPKEEPFHPQEWQPPLPPAYPPKYISSNKGDVFQPQNSKQTTALWMEGHQPQERAIWGPKVGLSPVRMWLKCWCHSNRTGPHTATWPEIHYAQSD